MTNPDYRIPDDIAAEVLAEAARLYAEGNKGYSLTDLERACSEVQIPPDIMRQAIRNVEEKRSHELSKRRQQQEYIKQQAKKGISFGIALLIPAIAVSSIFIFRSHLKPVVSELVSRLKPHQQPKQEPPDASFKTLTVKQGKLEYLTDSKGLSIAISSASRYSSSVEGTIGTDGYTNFAIQSGKVGDFYEYKGIYNYLIKIIEVGDNSVTFQIEPQGCPFIKRKNDPSRDLEVGLNARDSMLQNIAYVNNHELQDREQYALFMHAVLKDPNICVSFLHSILKHPDKTVRYSAISLLRDLEIMGVEDSSIVSDLIAALKDPDKDMRISAFQDLGDIGTDASPAVPELTTALTDPDRNVRVNAAHVLDSVGVEASPAVLYLVAALKDPDRDVRIAASLALRNIGQAASPAVPELVTLLKDPRKEVREDALLILMGIGQTASPAAHEIAMAAFEDLDKDVRNTAFTALIRLSGTSILPALPVLLTALKGPNKDVRSSAAVSLSYMGKEASPAVPELYAALKDPDPQVRKWSAVALGSLGVIDDKLLPFVPDILDEIRLRHQQGAGADRNDPLIKAIKNMSTAYPSIISNLRTQLKDSDIKVSSSAAATLIPINTDASALLKVRTALKDPDKNVRLIAAQALGKVGVDGLPAVPELAAALKDSDKEVRLGAVGVLWNMTSYASALRAVVPELAAALKDSDAEIRWKAVQALSNIDTDVLPAIPELIAGLAASLKSYPETQDPNAYLKILEKIALTFQKKPNQLSPSELDQAISDFEEIFKISQDQFLQSKFHDQNRIILNGIRPLLRALKQEKQRLSYT